MADLVRPGTLAEATSFLADHPDAMAVAGGTDLVIDRRLERVSPLWLVDLTAIPGLSEIMVEPGRAVIGGLTRVRDLELDPVLTEAAGALTEAARVLGSVQIRNMATVGGNLAHASPAAELAPPLLVHDALLKLSGPDGEREIPLAELFTGPGTTSLRIGELITRISLLPRASCYLRQTVRWAMDLAGVGVAVAVELDGDRVSTAAVALGAVAPTPLLVPEAAEVLVGTRAEDGAARMAGRIAAAASQPISDARGPADYRRRVVAALVLRAVATAYRRAPRQA